MEPPEGGRERWSHLREGEGEVEPPERRGERGGAAGERGRERWSHLREGGESWSHLREGEREVEPPERGGERGGAASEVLSCFLSFNIHFRQ